VAGRWARNLEPCDYDRHPPISYGLVLFLIDLASRSVEIGGVAREANGLWMSQVARNLSDAAEGFLAGQTPSDP